METKQAASASGPVEINRIRVEDSDAFMPYEPVVTVSPAKLVFLSGATALPLYHDHPHRHDRLDPPADVREQTRLVMQSLTRCLDAAGARWSDVVRIDVYLTDMDDQDAVGEELGAYFQGVFPASTFVEVSRLVDPRLKIEINAIAAVGP
ncbi:RidA family protein [Nocardia transvalensis]|uniref:RidA family protein n=1 Tax=Nocardia transvalensis TaxID=37333 RepID=UPI001893CB16|nr:Rid family hydrolase [Nocardia transvalensis]MBF6332990.1 RidA family protein [Nocardia transvalensis]